MKTKLCLLTVVTLLVGCGPTHEEAKQLTEASASAPTLVTEHTSKGKLWRIAVAREGTVERDYVYYFDNSTNTISVNYTVPRGKTHINQTIVIDGEEYTLQPK